MFFRRKNFNKPFDSASAIVLLSGTPMARRSKYFALFLLTFLLCWSALAMPRPHHRINPRDQIVILEQEWRQAQLSDDIPAMEKLLSEDYVGITVSGQVVTRAQQLDRMRQRQLVVTRFETSDMKIKLIAGGKVAIVNASAQVEGNADTRRIDGNFRYTRVYQRLPSGAWKITSFEATRIPKEK